MACFVLFFWCDVSLAPKKMHKNTGQKSVCMAGLTKKLTVSNVLIHSVLSENGKRETQKEQKESAKKYVFFASFSAFFVLLSCHISRVIGNAFLETVANFACATCLFDGFLCAIFDESTQKYSGNTRST